MKSFSKFLLALTLMLSIGGVSFAEGDNVDGLRDFLVRIIELSELDGVDVEGSEDIEEVIEMLDECDGEVEVYAEMMVADHDGVIVDWTPVTIEEAHDTLDMLMFDGFDSAEHEN